MAKYDDGRYHVEQQSIAYKGGDVLEWVVVNVYGEPVVFDKHTIVFPSERAAKKYCDELNVCPAGALIIEMC